MLKILKCSITTPDPPHWYYPRCKTRELFCPREGWWPAPGSSRSPPCPSDLFHSCPGEETCQRTHEKFACNGKPGVQCLDLFSAEARFLLQKPCQSKPGVVTWIVFSSSAWRWREDLVGFCFQRAKLGSYRRRYLELPISSNSEQNVSTVVCSAFLWREAQRSACQFCGCQTTSVADKLSDSSHQNNLKSPRTADYCGCWLNDVQEILPESFQTPFSC